MVANAIDRWPSLTLPPYGNFRHIDDHGLAVAEIDAAWWWLPGAPDTAKTPLPVTRLRTVQRVSRLVDTMTGAADNDVIRRFANEICRLPAKGYGTLEFGMTGPRLESFLAAGRTAMQSHLTP